MSHTFSRKIWGFLVGSILLFEPFLLQATVPTNDPFLSEQWYLETISATDVPEITEGSPRVIVAVLDAGFDLDHPDLIGQFWKNTGEISGNGKDDDGNGFEDDVQGWDFVDEDPLPLPALSAPFNDTVVSHGTVIAGMIAATANNTEGIRGIAPHVTIMPLRIVNPQGAGSSSNVREAIVYAVQNGAQVINLSFTTDKFDERLYQTIEWAVEQGVVIVTAVGNGNRDVDKKPTFPACFDLYGGRDLVLGVTATDRENKKASFANFGSSCTDVSAPGTNIFATVFHDPSNLLTSTAYSSPWEGTSIAAPMVSAAAALLKVSYPSLTPQQVHLAIKLSVDPVGETSVEARTQLGAGILNISRALDAARVFARDVRSNILPSAKYSKSFFAVEGPGVEPRVNRFDARGHLLHSFLAYHQNFRGGVSIAVGDVNGDGAEEVVTGARRGGGPQVRVFDVEGNVLSQFFADDPSDRHGIFVFTGDTNGDGIAEIFVTPESGGTGEVKIFNRFGQLEGMIRPFGREAGTIRLTFGNMDEDPEEEIVAMWSKNPNPAIRILDGNGRYIREIQVANRLREASISSGDIDGDGTDEIILASGRGEVPYLEIFSPLGQQEQSFATFNSFMRAGIQTCVGDIDQNGRAEMYVTPRQGGGPHLQMYDTGGQLLGSFFTFSSQNRSGATCAIWNP